MIPKFNISTGDLLFKVYFLTWKDANHVEEFYNQRIENYLYNYSHEKTIKDDHLEGDKLYYSGVTKDGIEITETDFINHEILGLNRIPEQQLNFDEKKRMDFYRQYLQKKLINMIFGETKPLPKPEIDINQDFVNKTWFKAGLTFATGRAQELYERYKNDKGHFLKIAIKLGFKPTDRPYFSATINNTTVDNKNIYCNPDKLQKIYAYCQVKKITVCPDFLSQIPTK